MRTFEQIESTVSEQDYMEFTAEQLGKPATPEYVRLVGWCVEYLHEWQFDGESKADVQARLVDETPMFGVSMREALEKEATERWCFIEDDDGKIVHPSGCTLGDLVLDAFSIFNE